MMRRPTIVAAVLFAVLVMVQPAAGAHTAVVSIHTTEADFNSANALTNLNIDGSGTNANVTLDSQTGTTANRPNDNGQDGSVLNKRGLAINPNTDLVGVELTVSDKTVGASTAYLADTSGNILDSSSLSGTTRLEAPLSAGTIYYVLLDNDGSTWFAGFEDFEVTPPYGSTDIDIVGGKNGLGGGGKNTGKLWAVDTVTAVKSVSSAQYNGSEHTADRVTAGFTDLTLDGASANVTWQGYDGSNWVVVDTTTYTTPGNKTATLSGGYAKWRTNISFDSAGSGDVATLEDEGILATTSAPTLDNSSASPSGGGKINSQPTYSINGSDVDFSTAQGDTVTLEWYQNGAKVGETTESTNGTWTFSPPDSGAGTTTWHVVTTDEYGETHNTTSQTFTYDTPSVLSIFNESAPSTLIDDTDIRVRYFEDGTENVVEREVTDGTADLTGVPVGSRLIVTLKGNSTKFEYRRIVLESLYEQQSAYLLPTSSNSVPVNFRIEDSTGRFPASESVLYIERALTKDFDDDGDNETKYQTIAGDTFGAAENFPAVLEKNERYRLRVENEEGEVRVLGSYTPTVSTTEIIRIGSVSFQPDDETDVSFDAELYTENGQRYIRVTYIDTADATSDLTLNITRADGSNVLQPNTTHSGPFGTYQATYQVPASAPENATYAVTWEVTRNGGTRGDVVYVGDVPPIADDFGVDVDVLSMIGYIAIIAVLGLTAIKSPSKAGIPTTAVAGGLVAIGVVQIPALLIGGAGVISLLFAAGGER